MSGPRSTLSFHPVGLRVAHRLMGYGLLGAAACAPPEPRPPLEDVTRRVTPVPACAVPVQGRAAGGARRALRERELWKLVFPAFDTASFRLPADARACNNQVTLREALGEAPSSPWVQGNRWVKTRS